MKPSPPSAKPAAETLRGVYRQPIYSPKGGIEGVLLERADGAVVQIVFDERSESQPFAALSAGQSLELSVRPAGPSPKGEAAHLVFSFEALHGVDGHRAAAVPKRFEGRVARLNYARHGEPNGVVLDSGDFIHLRPQGFKAVALAVGDTVRAEGEAQPMSGGGWVVEARQLNGHAIEPKPPKPGPKPAHGHEPKHGPKDAHGHKHDHKHDHDGKRAAAV